MVLFLRMSAKLVLYETVFVSDESNHNEQAHNIKHLKRNLNAALSHAGQKETIMYIFSIRR